MSKGKRYATIIVFLGFIATPLFATPRYLETGLHQQLGLEGYHHTYTETVDNHFFMDLKGPMFGIYYNLAFQPETDINHFK